MRVGVGICHDVCFTEWSQQLIPTNPAFFQNIGSEAFSTSEALKRQVLDCTRLRALESRTPIVRCVSAGTTCAIDAAGRTTLPVGPDSASGIGVMTVPLNAGQSVYAWAGNWPASCGSDSISTSAKLNWTGRAQCTTEGITSHSERVVFRDSMSVSHNPHVSPTYTLSDAGELAGQRVTVLGLGSFGGGAGAVRFLVEQGASVRVSDRRSEEQLSGTLQQLSDVPDVEYALGSHEWTHFSDADLVVVNPAIPPEHELLRQLRDASIPLSSEMSLFWQLNCGRVIAVTGSNGKSTTTALTHALLTHAGQKCWLGGNIGVSLLPELHSIESDDWVVMELSSFQLHQLDAIQARPDIAVVTNFAPNHLDWHRSLDHYRHSKQAILRWQRADDWCVLNALDHDVMSWPHESRTVSCGTQGSSNAWLEDTRAVFELPRLGVSMDFARNLRLRGQHNRQNALQAITAALLTGVSAEDIEAALPEFQSLPHRLEFVGEHHGRSFYNDSISTTPESTIAALQSFEEPVVILAGGYDKQVDLAAMARHIAQSARAAILMGQTGPELGRLIDRERSVCHYIQAVDFNDAVTRATALASPGNVVLLSPGCASYDWFDSFTDRGDQFRNLVRKLTNG